MLYTLNLYNVVCQLYLNKTEEKRNLKRKPTMLQNYSNQISMLLAK